MNKSQENTDDRTPIKDSRHIYADVIKIQGIHDNTKSLCIAKEREIKKRHVEDINRSEKKETRMEALESKNRSDQIRAENPDTKS